MTQRPQLPARRITIAWCAIVLSMARHAYAQADPDSTVRVILVTGDSRWRNAGEPERFAYSQPIGPQLLRIDSTRIKGSGNQIFITPYYDEFESTSRIHTIFDRNRAGQVTGMRSTTERDIFNRCPRPLPPVLPLIAPASQYYESERNELLRDVNAMLQSSPTNKRKYTTAIRFVSNLGTRRSAMRGIRVSRVLRDTVAGGRRTQIVRDSATVVVTTAEQDGEWPWLLRPAGMLSRIERTAAGLVVGTRMVDFRSGRTESFVDTMTLHGTVSVHFADGRIASTATSFNAVRRVARLPLSAAEPQFIQALRRSGGYFDGVVSDTTLGRRLGARDPQLRDSLFHAVLFASQRSQRDSAWQLLADSFNVSWGTMEKFRLAAGDTAGYLASNELSFKSLVQYPWLHRFIADPAYALRFDQSSDKILLKFITGLMENLPALTSDSTRWPCLPTICRMLAAEWPSAKDPTLRNAALLVRFAFNPRQWGDTIIRRARTDRSLTAAADFVVGARTPSVWAGRRAPVPPEQADWHRWADWLTDGYSEQSAAGMWAPIMSQAKRHALQLNEMMSGRSFVDEFISRFRSEASDSGRYVFGLLVDGLNPNARSDSEVFQAFTTGTALDRDLSYNLFWGRVRTGPAPDSTDVAAIMQRFLAMIIHGAPRWDTLPGSPVRDAAKMRPDSLPATVARYAVADSISPWVRDSLARYGYKAMPYSWKRADTTESVTLFVHPLEARGPVVSLAATRVIVERLANGSFQGTSDSWSVMLVKKGDGWHIFAPTHSPFGLLPVDRCSW